MTNKEAVKILKNVYICRINIKDGCYPWECRNCEHSEDKDDVTQAINYAVQVLSKQSASDNQADKKLFGHGYWLMPGEVFISHNALNEVLNTIIKSTNTEQRKIDSILAKTAENDEAIRTDDHIADDSKKVDQFRKATKKTEDVLLNRYDVIEAVDRHTREDGTLDDDISCILEEVSLFEQKKSNSFSEKPSEDSESEMNSTKFKPGDKFILELGQERRMFDEFEIAGTDLYVKTDLLEKLKRYEPISLESAIDYLHEVGWLQEHDRVLTEHSQPEKIPYEKSEIIHCESCKHWTHTPLRGYGLGKCDFHDDDLVTRYGSCGSAERRNDG